jgi:GGDEF domain-containing protein
MILSDSLTADFTAAVQGQSWDWFLELPYRLNIAAELVDEKGTPILPAGDGAAAAMLRPLLARPVNRPLRSSLSATIKSKAPQFLHIERLDIGCFPLMVGGAVGGALVLARESSDRSSVELQTLGSWLSSVVQAQLANARKDEDGAFDRVASLHGLLNQAVTMGNPRDVVGAFADALAIWDDIEVRGYAEDILGKFVLEVSLPGSDTASAPAALDDDFVRGERGVVRLPKGDANRLGFRSDDDVLVATFGQKAGECWLIALSGRIAPRDEPRLALSIKMLSEAVRHTGRIVGARVDWAILQHLLVATDDVESAARAALAEVTAAVRSSGTILIVTTSNGMHVMDIGDTESSSAPPAPGQRNQMVSAVQLLDRYRMVLAARRADAKAFMRRDQQIVDGAAALFGSWVAGILRRPEYNRERRAVRQRFEDVIERMAEQTVRHGASVSVVVMTAAEAHFEPDLLRRCVTDIRAQLRDSDMVGTLTPGEIAVLLSETTAADAHTVIRRLRDHVHAEGGGFPAFSIGVVTRSADWPANKSVVDAAREDARRRECA